MRLGVIGTDAIGTFIGAWASKIGYEVLFSSKHLLHDTTDAAMVAEESDLVFLATNFEEGIQVVKELAPLLMGKIIVDVIHPRYLKSAEEIARIAPSANVVKIFNQDFERVHSFSNPAVDEKVKSLMYAGNNSQAKAVVAEIFQRLGFDTIDGGDLANSRRIFTYLQHKTA